MKHRQPHEIAFAENIKLELPRIPWRLALDIAEHRFANDRPVNSAKGKTGSIYVNAVVAHIRHLRTDYDNLFKMGFLKEEARKVVNEEIERYLRQWR